MSGKDKLELKTIWLGLTVALGFWFLSGIIALLWVIFSDAGVFHLGMFVYLLGIVGVLLGGAVAGIKAKYKGWLHGLWVGLLLGILGIIVNLELVPELYTWGLIGRQILVWTLWGLIGGYLGAHFLTRLAQMGKIKGIKRKPEKGRSSL
ncbi:MAG: TIGR04086 family membrane protein [Peptococcia bacterium]|jgi:putative membrane protein (TIGR04086 family)